MRSRHAVVVAAIVTAATGCEWPPKAQADKARQIAEQFDRESKAEAAASKKKADEEFKIRIAQPGSISVEESDALIAKLDSADPTTRGEAANSLAAANGARAVAPLILALRAERDEKTFVAFIKALEALRDARATDAFVEALAAPGMPDAARMDALYAINNFRSTWRFIPQIREFHASLTDEDLRRRVGDLLARYEK